MREAVMSLQRDALRNVDAPSFELPAPALIMGSSLKMGTA